MRTLFVVLSALFYSGIFAQRDPSLQGRWKVIAVAGDDMYYNLKTASVTLTPAFDPLMDQEQAKQLITLVFKKAGEGLFTLGKDGHYEVLQNGRQDGVGSYLVNTKDSLVVTKLTRNGVQVTEKLKFYIKDKLLHLDFLSNEGLFMLVLEQLPKN